MDNEFSLYETACKLLKAGLNHGATGNCSCRAGDNFLITPSGISNNDLDPKMMVKIDLQGNIINQGHNLEPSSEWRFHQAILREKKEINAVVHTHSPFASTLSVLNLEIPSFHYMIAVAGGDSVRCASYAMFGTQNLSDNILKSLHNRKACLIANHGLVSIGRDLEEAYMIAEEIEHLSHLYIEAKKVGQPKLLSKKEMNEVIERFNSYGNWSKD
jgi:L-fuculose-phosphate aldolase